MTNKTDVIEIDSILESVGNSRDYLSAITLAAKMLKLPYNQRTLVDKISRIESELTTIEYVIFNDWMKYEIDKLNADNPCGIRQGYILELRKDNSLVLAGQDVIYTLASTSKKEVENFEAAKPAIYEKVKEMKKAIDTAFDFYKKIIHNAIAKLNNEPFIISKNAIRSQWSNKYPRMEGVTQCVIRYNCREEVVFVFDFRKPLPDYATELNNVYKELADKMQIKLVEDRERKFHKLVEEICVKNKLMLTKFDTPTSNLDKLWDFRKGLVNKNFDTGDVKHVDKFEKELVSAVKAIESLYFSNTDHINPTGNIVIGNKYYYRKIKTANLAGEQYDIYECRIGTRKPLLHVVHEGRRLFGFKRMKIIREVINNKS